MKGIVVFAMMFLSGFLHAQYHESVFKDLDGNALKEALQEAYRPSSVLSYTQARDTFMGKIDLVDGKLYTLYTNYSITMPSDVDPTTYAFSQGVNTEHVYPRSKGPVEGTLAYSDMHHLFPARADVNTDRSDLPMAEIDDNLTSTWYRFNYEQTSIPTEFIDEYSERRISVAFEPREAMKGDIARAYFYVRTIYEEETNREAPDFFDTQVEDLCLWHAIDPVDEKEWNRTKAIAQYQDGKENPFVLDCSLARLYCPELSADCIAVDVTDIEDAEIETYPNPFSRYLHIVADTEGEVQLFSIAGVHIETRSIVTGENKLDISHLVRGTYVLKVYNHNHDLLKVEKLIKQ